MNAFPHVPIDRRALAALALTGVAGLVFNWHPETGMGLAIAAVFLAHFALLGLNTGFQALTSFFAAAGVAAMLFQDSGNAALGIGGLLVAGAWPLSHLGWRLLGYRSFNLAAVFCATGTLAIVLELLYSPSPIACLAGFLAAFAVLESYHAAILAFDVTGQSRPAWQVSPGQPAPDFTLAETNGGTFQLTAQARQDAAVPAVILFVRGERCPGTHQLLREFGRFAARSGILCRLAAITTDSPAAVAALQEKLRLSFPLLSDPDGNVTRLYGAESFDSFDSGDNEPEPPETDGSGTEAPTLPAVPCWFSVDANGIIARTSDPERIGHRLDPAVAFPE